MYYNHFLDRFFIFREFQGDKIKNLESIFTICNYLIKEVPNTVSGNKGELSKLNNQKQHGTNFYVI